MDRAAAPARQLGGSRWRGRARRSGRGTRRGTRRGARRAAGRAQRVRPAVTATRHPGADGDQRGPALPTGVRHAQRPDHQGLAGDDREAGLPHARRPLAGLPADQRMDRVPALPGRLDVPAAVLQRRSGAARIGYGRVGHAVPRLARLRPDLAAQRGLAVGERLCPHRGRHVRRRARAGASRVRPRGSAGRPARPACTPQRPAHDRAGPTRGRCGSPAAHPRRAPRLARAGAGSSPAPSWRWSCARGRRAPHAPRPA